MCETASRNACRSTGPPALPWHDGHDGRNGRNGMSFIYFHEFSMAFLSSFCSQFLSSVPREIITVYYGPRPQDLRRLARFPDVFSRISSIFLRKDHIAVTRAHLDTSWYIWARFKEKTQNCPVLKCSLVATGPSRTRRCNRDTFHSGSPSYWRSMRAIDDKWIELNW